MRLVAQHLMKSRIGLLPVFLLSAGGTVWNWHLFSSQGYYYPMMSLIGPPGTAVLLCLLLFPSIPIDQTQRDKRQTLIVNIVAWVGMLLGGINWYLMGARL